MSWILDKVYNARRLASFMVITIRSDVALTGTYDTFLKVQTMATLCTNQSCTRVIHKVESVGVVTYTLSPSHLPTPWSHFIQHPFAEVHCKIFTLKLQITLKSDFNIEV